MASVNAPLDQGRPPFLLDGALFRETIVTDGGAGPVSILQLLIPEPYTRWVLLAASATPYTPGSNVGNLLITVPDGEGTRRLLNLGGPFNLDLGVAEGYSVEHLSGLAFWTFPSAGPESIITISIADSVAGPHDATIFNLTWKLEYSSAPPSSNDAPP